MNVHFSSERHDWATPRAILEGLQQELGTFDLDVCATPTTAAATAHYGPVDNALWQRWRGLCWMNPPYGRTIGQWVRRARESAEAGATVVCLLPSRTDTAWFHDHILNPAVNTEIRFLRGRLRFSDAINNAPFPSCIVIFRP